MCARFQFASCTLAKRWCMHQPVNVYRSCLKQYLICGWLYRSQHDNFQKHQFELKLFFSIFLRVITKSNLIKQVWSCKPMRHCKYSGNPWIHSKTRRNVYKNIKLWKWCAPIFLHSTVHFPAWRTKDKFYFNVFSPSIHWGNCSQKKGFY